MVTKVSTHASDKLDLLIGTETGNGHLEHVAKVDLVNSDESVIVDVCEEAHDELAVHAIRHTTVAGDGVTEVLDLECALQARGEEASEWGNQRSERGKVQRMDLHRGVGKGKLSALGKEEQFGKLPGSGEENWVDVAFEASENIGAKILL